MKIKQAPRYVDMDKCIACGICAEKCPRKIPDEDDANLIKCKAIGVRYAQAVPLKYAIDAQSCIYFIKGRCKACEKFCPTGAILFDDQEKEITLNVGAVVLNTGSQTYDPAVHDTYGYKKSPNIVTSLEFERILSASGPYGGHLVRPSDKKEPEKIAWLQCIGSRDEHLGAKGYCSGVCCTYAIKEAMLAMDHQKGLDTAIFYIDIRTVGRLEKFYYDMLEDTNVSFIKGKVAEITEDSASKDLILDVEDTLSRENLHQRFDLVILATGMVPNSADVKIPYDLEYDKYGFIAGVTDVAGVYPAGCAKQPCDVSRATEDSTGAALRALQCLAGGD